MKNAQIIFGKTEDEHGMVEVTVEGYEPVRPVFDLVNPNKRTLDFTLRTNKPTDEELKNIEKQVWSCYIEGFEENCYYLDYAQALYMAWCIIQEEKAESSELWIEQSKQAEVA